MDLKYVPIERIFFLNSWRKMIEKVYIAARQESSFCEHSFWSRECTIPRTGLKSFSFKMYSSEKLGESVKWKKLERVTVCVLSSRMSCVAQRTVASISVKKRDKKRNSFISAFCFIKLIFQVDWMYTRFVVMWVLRLMLGKCRKKSGVMLRNALGCPVSDPRVY